MKEVQKINTVVCHVLPNLTLMSLIFQKEDLVLSTIKPTVEAGKARIDGFLLQDGLLLSDFLALCPSGDTTYGVLTLERILSKPANHSNESNGIFCENLNNRFSPDYMSVIDSLNM